MAKTKFNPWMENVRGKVGDLVFRLVDGQMVIGRKPPPSTTPPTAGQLEQRERWYQASRYARAVFGDPAKRAPYEQATGGRLSRLWSVIMSDFLKPPVIDGITLTGYAGRIDDSIVIRASDDVGVVGVAVKIKDPTGTELEQGAANFINGEWLYRATTNIPVDQPLTIEATATDRPGNTGIRSVIRPAS